MGDTSDRLTLPKRQDKVGSSTFFHGSQNPTDKVRPHEAVPVGLEGVPSDPLPVWLTLPLDSKLPMMPAPKGAVVLHTTNIGEKIHKSTSELDFDLTDPYSMLMSNDYKPLHDPHLKTHFSSPNIQKRLASGGFITNDGKVICSLKEYNDYRQYLRKISLALERKQEQEKNAKSNQAPKTKDSGTLLLAREREEKIKEIRMRLAQQHERDRQRYLKLKAEDEQRKKRMQVDQLNKMTARERDMRERDDKRVRTVKKRQYEERRRKLALLHSWLEQDSKRKSVSQIRRREKATERQNKLQEAWDVRKKVQADKIEEDSHRLELENQRKQERITQREQEVRLRQQRQQEEFQRMSERRRLEREALEDLYLREFAAKIEKRRADLARRLKPKRKGKKRKKIAPRSNWDIKQAILKTVSDDDLGRLSSQGLATKLSSMHSLPNLDTREDLSSEGVDLDKNIQRSIGELSLGNNKASGLHKDSSKAPEAGQPSVKGPSDTTNEDGVRFVENVDLSVTSARRTTAGDLYEALRSLRLKDEDSLAEDEHLDDVEKAAKAIVDMTVFLTTQVIYPAYLRYLKEDHPDAYSQHFEQTTPLPMDNAITVGGKANQVDILDLRDVEPCPSCTDVTVKPKANPKSVSFSKINETITIADYDLLETLRFMQHRSDFYDAEDELDTIWQQIEHDYEKIVEAEEDDGELSETDIGLTAKDSRDLTLKNITSQELSNEDISHVLQQLVQQLNRGNLRSRELQQLGFMAKDIISNFPNESMSDELSDLHDELQRTLSSTSTTSLSIVAEEIVQETIENIHRLLVENDSNKQEPIPTTVTALSAYIVSKAINLAINQMIDIEDVKQSKPRPGSAPPTTPVPDNYSQTTDLVRVRSATSDYVNNILINVVREVEEEVRREMKEPSKTSLYVKRILQDAEEDLMRTWSFENLLDWDNAPLLKRSSESITGQFVKDTIFKVVQELEEETPPDNFNLGQRSSMSVFAEKLVTDTIQSCLNDVRSNTMSQQDLVAVTTAVLRERPVISRASTSTPLSHTVSLEHFVTTELPPNATSSTLIEAFIQETMMRVKCAIDQGTLSTVDVLKLAKDADIATAFPHSANEALAKSAISMEAEKLVVAAFAETDDSLSKTELMSMFRNNENSNVPPKSAISIEAEKLIASVITEEEAKLTKSDLINLLRGPNTYTLTASQPGPKSSISAAAEKMVASAIQTAEGQLSRTDLANLLRGGQENSTSVAPLPPKSAVSSEAERVIAMAIENAKSVVSSNCLPNYNEDAVWTTSEHRSTKDKSELSIKAECLVAAAIDEAVHATRSHSGKLVQGQMSSTSQLAEEYVQRVLNEISISEPDIDVSQNSSFVAERAVQLAIEEAFEGTINNERQPSSAVSELAASLVKKAIDEILENKSSLSMFSSTLVKEDLQSDKSHSLIKEVMSSIMKLPDNTNDPLHDQYENVQMEESHSLIKEAVSSAMKIPDSSTNLLQDQSDDILMEESRSMIEDAPGSAMKLPDSTNDLLQDQSNGLLHMDHHIILDCSHLDDESSEDEEVSVCPVMGNVPLAIDHHVVENALSVLSVKKDKDLLMHTEACAARNSFVDLMHPDISTLKRFQDGNESEVCQKLMTLSKHCISLPAHITQSDEEPACNMSLSAGATLCLPDDNLLTVDNEDQDRLSTDGQDDIVNVVTLHKAESLEELHQASVESSQEKTESKTPKKKISKEIKRILTPKSSKTSKTSITKKEQSNEVDGKKSSRSLFKRKSSKEMSSKINASRDKKSVRSRTDIQPSVKSASSNQLQNKESTSDKRAESTSIASVSQVLSPKVSQTNAKKDTDQPKDANLKENAAIEEMVANPSADHLPPLSIPSTPEPEVSNSSDLVNTTDDTTPNLGRESPAAETVDEEELPVKKRSSRRGMSISKSKSNYKPEASSSGQIATGSVCREEVMALSSKFSKALSISSRASLAKASSSKQSSHQMVNLTPRPSSGYRKSITKESISREYVKREHSGNDVSPSSQSISKKSSESLNGPLPALPKRVLLTPKQSQTSLMSLKNNDVTDAPSDTSCTHSENGNGCSSRTDLGSLPDVVGRTSTGSLPGQTDSSSLVTKMSSKRLH